VMRNGGRCRRTRVASPWIRGGARCAHWAERSKATDNPQPFDLSGASRQLPFQGEPTRWRGLSRLRLARPYGAQLCIMHYALCIINSVSARKKADPLSRVCLDAHIHIPPAPLDTAKLNPKLDGRTPKKESSCPRRARGLNRRGYVSTWLISCLRRSRLLPFRCKLRWCRHYRI